MHDECGYSSYDHTSPDHGFSDNDSDRPPTTTAEPTMVPVKTTIVITAATTVPAEKVILHETGVLTTEDYKTYDFKTLMGYKFLYTKDKFRITIKSEKPVLGYVTRTERAGQLQVLIPRNQTYVKGSIEWGLIEL